MPDARQSRFFLALAAAVLLCAASAAAQSPPSQAPVPAVGPSKPDARKARKAYEKGLRAEQGGNWLAAFEAYTEATTYAPANTDALRRREAARFRLVQKHTDRAEREALAGRLDLASDVLRAALGLDPGYSVARERLAQFKTSAAQQPQQNPFGIAGPVRLAATRFRRPCFPAALLLFSGHAFLHLPARYRRQGRQHHLKPARETQRHLS
jgi:tetratricopeptide (TPR) repeat protein